MTPETLKQVFSSAGLSLSARQVEQFVLYCDLLLNWNRRVSLISKGDENNVLARHFLESAVLSHYEEIRPGIRMLDLGSGGGFPGLPMKIVRPDLAVTLLEARRKKSLFLQRTVAALGLTDTAVVCERAEELAKVPQFCGAFDVVVARAVAALAILYRWSAPLLQKRGVLIAVKSSRIDEEKEQFSAAFPGVRMVEKSFPLPQQGNRLKAVLCWPSNC